MKLFGIELESPRRRRGQVASSERENYLSFILDRVPAGILQTGLDGRYVYVNSYFCELTGRSLQELVGLHFEKITHPDDVSENARLFARAVETGEPYTFRKRYVRPDGTAVWAEVNVTALSERHEGLLSVVVDLTSRMRAEAQKNLLIEERTGFAYAGDRSYAGVASVFDDFLDEEGDESFVFHNEDIHVRTFARRGSAMARRLRSSTRESAKSCQVNQIRRDLATEKRPRTSLLLTRLLRALVVPRGRDFGTVAAAQPDIPPRRSAVYVTATVPSRRSMDRRP